jgi:LPS-assembly lipoprotein
MLKDTQYGINKAFKSDNVIMKTSVFKNDQAWSIRFWRLMSITLLMSLLVMMTAGLNGCGFHLRGLDRIGYMQFKTVKLQSLAGVRPEIEQAMRSQLAQSGVQLVDSMAAAELQIILQPTLYKVNRTAYSGLGDTTAEFMSMEQPFSAILVATDETIVSSSAQAYRDRQIDTAALLAANSELGSIHREMAEDLVMNIMERINRAMLKASPGPKIVPVESTLPTITPTTVPTD